MAVVTQNKTHPALDGPSSSSSSCPRCHPRRPALIVILGHPHCHSTRDPPHEQLLARLGVSGVSSIRGSPGVIVVCCRSPSPLLLVGAAACRRPTCDPPHEQLLMRLGVGCVVSCSLPVPSLLLSTLRAEARNSGGAVLLTVSSRCCSTIET